ncbi:MAG: SurA N-terminal domain-containing protein [Candidatus Omnitrophica bacterium]|nr:SurA N-terminal domain-containing protein [Candidatus Omnitrophota bacterium]
MMKKILSILLVLFIFSGCGKIDKSSPVAIEIDKIKITVNEFEEAFKNSFYAKEDTPSSRKEFLDYFVTRKLILKEAEKQSLDKDQNFLKDVELFWEQSLLKRILDRKIKELSLNVKIDDREIRNYYRAHKADYFKDKELGDVYGEIKWLILKEKQREAIEEWTNSLRKDSKVKIEYELLKMGK